MDSPVSIKTRMGPSADGSNIAIARSEIKPHQNYSERNELPGANDSRFPSLTRLSLRTMFHALLVPESRYGKIDLK